MGVYTVFTMLDPAEEFPKWVTSYNSMAERCLLVVPHHTSPASRHFLQSPPLYIFRDNLRLSAILY